MTVIGTVGLPGSGKGEAAEVARAMGIPVVTMGDVVRQACRDRGLEPETHHGDVAQRLREESGESAIAERSLPTIRDHLSESDVVLVDGLRSPAEVDRFQTAFGDEFLLVSIEAPFELRADRLRSRGRELTDEDETELKKRERRELDFGMGDVMEMADVTLENTDDLETFHDRVRELLSDPGAILGGPGPGER